MAIDHIECVCYIEWPRPKRGSSKKRTKCCAVIAVYNDQIQFVLADKVSDLNTQPTLLCK